MTDRYREHGPLDPRMDPDRWERAVAGIVVAAGPDLARRAQDRGTVQVLEGWARPMLAVAASLALVASATLLQTAGEASPEARVIDDGFGTVAEAFVGSELAAWIEGGYSLSADELVAAIDEM